MMWLILLKVIQWTLQPTVCKNGCNAPITLEFFVFLLLRVHIVIIYRRKVLMSLRKWNHIFLFVLIDISIYQHRKFFYALAQII